MMQDHPFPLYIPATIDNRAPFHVKFGLERTHLPCIRPIMMNTFRVSDYIPNGVWWSPCGIAYKNACFAIAFM